MESVYHYCSIGTFLKIIQGRILRLSDIEKSNDYTERIYMENIIHKELIKRSERVFERELLDDYLHVEKRCRDSMRESHILYAICFSEEKDLLSQWREYANAGTGVAIGFSKDILNRVNEKMYGLIFNRICYDEKQQIKFAGEQVQTIIDTMRYKNLFAAFAEVYENEIEKIGCMKSPGFYEEKEWRLCKAMTPQLRIERTAKYGEFELSKVREHCVRDQIVTYFDLSFQNVVDDFITEVVIGPSAKVTEIDIYRSLFINGFDIDKIKVSKSVITYR